VVAGKRANGGSGDECRPAQVRAAEYVRMSTDHQRYSTEDQSDAIREYAQRRGIEIVRTYSDHGKSGLSIAGRDGLRRLLADVRSDSADFTTILVYDVRRWGRFQDADESAFQKVVCKRAGITIQYCAEQFKNDGSPISTIVKGVKRAMAGECGAGDHPRTLPAPYGPGDAGGAAAPASRDSAGCSGHTS